MYRIVKHIQHSSLRPSSYPKFFSTVKQLHDNKILVTLTCASSSKGVMQNMMFRQRVVEPILNYQAYTKEIQLQEYYLINDNHIYIFEIKEAQYFDDYLQTLTKTVEKL